MKFFYLVLIDVVLDERHNQTEEEEQEGEMDTIHLDKLEKKDES